MQGPEDTGDPGACRTRRHSLAKETYRPVSSMPRNHLELESGMVQDKSVSSWAPSKSRSPSQETELLVLKVERGVQNNYVYMGNKQMGRMRNESSVFGFSAWVMSFTVGRMSKRKTTVRGKSQGNVWHVVMLLKTLSRKITPDSMYLIATLCVLLCTCVC